MITLLVILYLMNYTAMPTAWAVGLIGLWIFGFMVKIIASIIKGK